MKRKLGQFERAEVISDEYYCFYVVSIYFLDQGPDKDVLRTSLNKLQKRHPLLRMKIQKKGNKYFYDSQNVPKIP